VEVKRSKTSNANDGVKEGRARRIGVVPTVVVEAIVLSVSEVAAIITHS
jgi:hypothetical protein